MVIALNLWFSVIELLIFTLSGVFIVVDGIIVLSLPNTKTAGILTLNFSSISLSPRGFAPQGLPGGSDIVQSLQSEAPSLTTAALSIASEAQTVVSSAITAIQSDLGSAIPRNCTLGTTHFCLGYENSVTCSRLPLNVSYILTHAFPASSSIQIRNLEPLDQQLSHVTPGIIEGPFVLGIISTVILIIALQYAFWKEDPIFASLFCGLPSEIVLGGVGNIVCILSFACPIIVLWALYSKAEHLSFHITVQKGNLWISCIVLLCCAVAMTFCTASMFVRKYVLQRNR